MKKEYTVYLNNQSWLLNGEIIVRNYSVHGILLLKAFIQYLSYLLYIISFLDILK